MKHCFLLTLSALTIGACCIVRGQTSGQAKSGNPGSSDLTFLREAIEGNLAEIQTGQLAQRNGSNQTVKQFGQRMVTDHTNLLEQAKSIAAAKGITPPTAPSAKDQATYRTLAAKTGTAFDKAYITDMINDHAQDISHFEQEVNSGADPDIRALASKALPTLQEHLRLAENAARQLGISTTPGGPGLH